MTDSPDFNAHAGPLVSIGVPTFNRPEELATALRCITAQKYRNIEVIVSDNHSHDPRVRAVIAEFEASDKRIIASLKDKNRGAPYNFFSTLEMARGKYFMWAADDDILDSRFVTKGVAALESAPEYALWAATVRNVDLDGNTLKTYRGFSRFNANSRIVNLWRFVSEPEIMGKANIIYGLFHRTDLLAYMQKYPLRDQWAADISFMHGFLCRHRGLFSDEVLLGKTVPDRAMPQRSKEDIPYCKTLRIRSYFFLSYWLIADSEGPLNHLVTLSAMTWRLFRPILYRIGGRCR